MLQLHKSTEGHNYIQYYAMNRAELVLSLGPDTGRFSSVKVVACRQDC